MKNILLAIAAIALLAAVAFGVRMLTGESEDYWVCRDGNWVRKGNPTSTQPTNPCSEGESTSTLTPGEEEFVRSENIIVTSPQPNAEISLPVTIEGEARIFENNFAYRVKDVGGSILVEGFSTANSPDIGQFGDFKVVTNYAQPAGSTGTIEVFNYSAKDGSEENKVEIPVRFGEVDSQVVKVFYSNENKNPNMEDCSLVYASDRRVPETQAVARAALNELLIGPSQAEYQLGYRTSINSGVEIQKLTIVDGLAKVDFNQQLQESVGGSCRVQAIRSQITQTLLQFPTVKSVLISIDGEAETILQP